MKQIRRALASALGWASPRRWSILVEAVLALALALAAWPIVAVGNGEPEAVETVTAYLEALREGDAERAEEYVSDAYAQEADRTWLTPESMSSDWEIESVELKSASETTVHAVISAGDARAEGAFQLEGTEDDLKIANPYMYLSVSSPLFSSLEIGGLRGDLAMADGEAKSVALYPGFYPLFESVPAFEGDDGPSLLLLPGADGGAYGVDTVDLSGIMADHVAGSDAIEPSLNEDLAAWLDDCAESADLAPAGCPFSAEDYGGAYDGRTEFESVSELDWAVDTYPRVRFTRDLRLEVVEPGWMSLSGKGDPLLEDGGTTLDGRCGVELADLAPVIEEDGNISFTQPAEPGNTCF